MSLWEAAGGGPLDVGALLAMVRATDHPEADAVAGAVAALAESGAALTAAQAVDLKVSLWRSSPSLWRTVRMPLAATLGDLHRAIQVLFDWDGDHLHAFTAAGLRYSDFGAGWVHEVTRAGSSRFALGEAVPRCLSFSGDNPVEYWNEDEPVNPAPFNMAKVNAALADRV